MVSNLEAWYNVRDNHFTTVLGRKQAEIADNLWRLGYNMEAIARIFNQRSGIVVTMSGSRPRSGVTPEYISNLLKEFIYVVVEHPKINLFELLIEFGKKLWDKDGEYIGEYRTWTGDLLHKLNKNRPEILEKVVKYLIKKDKIKLRKKSELVIDIYIDKVDYSLMDEFSIRLFNALYYGQNKTFWVDDFFTH